MSVFSNMKEMMELAGKAKQIQADMKTAQAEIQSYTVTELDQSRQVQVTVLGDLSVQSVRIQPNAPALNDRAMLEACITDAVNHALYSMKIKVQERMKQATGGIDIPGM